MKKMFFISLSGFIFGIGLSMSTMLDRNRIINFLDIAGDWDPSLLFVMTGAVIVTLIFFRLILKRKKPVLDNKFYLPVKKQVDMRLVTGSVIFGAGWGLSGYCPGPGFAALTLGLQAPVIFCLGYIIGSIASKYYLQLLANDS